MTQNLVSIFKSSLKLGFYTKPRFTLVVIPAIMIGQMVQGRGGTI